MPQTPQTNDIEAKRQEALRHYDILDTPPDGAFDRIALLAATFFKAPIALVTLVDEDRIWFKSKYGIDAQEIPRCPGLCASAILADTAYVIKNARIDPRTLSNPLVVGEMGLQFYAAHPLLTHDGYRLGTINIIDFEPREFSPEDETMLKHFAGLVMDQMELKLSARNTISSLSKLLKENVENDKIVNPVTLCAWSKKIKINNQWLSFEEFILGELGLNISHGLHPDLIDEISGKSPS